jgi:hypothetical protein
MAETFTMNETPANPEILNSDEKDNRCLLVSLKIRKPLNKLM